MGSSLVAKVMMFIPGEVASHLCLMASAHPQDTLKACCKTMVGKVLLMLLLPFSEASANIRLLLALVLMPPLFVALLPPLML